MPYRLVCQGSTAIYSLYRSVWQWNASQNPKQLIEAGRLLKILRRHQEPFHRDHGPDLLQLEQHSLLYKRLMNDGPMQALQQIDLVKVKDCADKLKGVPIPKREKAIMQFCKAKAEIKAELDDEDHGAAESVVEVDRQSPRKKRKGAATKDLNLQNLGPTLQIDLHACAATQVALMVVTTPR